MGRRGGGGLGVGGKGEVGEGGGKIKVISFSPERAACLSKRCLFSTAV